MYIIQNLTLNRSLPHLENVVRFLYSITMASARKETSAGVASSSKSRQSKHSKSKSRSGGASKTIEICNSQEFSLSKPGNRSKSKQCSRLGVAKITGVFDHSDDVLSQQQILERITSLSQLLSPGIRERAGSIMLGTDDSPSARKSGSICKSSRKSDASFTHKGSYSGVKTKDVGDTHEVQAEDSEEEEEDLCGHRAKSITFKKLSKEEVCIYEEGQIHMDREGKKFMNSAMELVKLYCHDIHLPWPLVKRSHKERVIHALKNDYGTGFSSRWVLGRLAKRWNDYIYKLRKQVRENPRMKKPQDCKTDEAWEKFKEDCKKENNDKKNAAAARKSKPKLGSGEIDSKVEFFEYFRGYPTTLQIEEIKSAGGFEEWIKTQEVSEFKFDAMDFAGKGPTKCILKAKDASKKDHGAGTSKSNLDVEATNPLGDGLVRVDGPSIVSDSEDLDIIVSQLVTPLACKLLFLPGYTFIIQIYGCSSDFNHVYLDIQPFPYRS